MNINVSVKDKVAGVVGTPVIICGNSDYKILFDFDAEWETLDAKTARFVYAQNGELCYTEVAFGGREVAVPILTNVNEVFVGVYSGELHTTTPARVLCKKSILCPDADPHEPPAADVYDQIIELLNNADKLPTVTAADAGKVMTVNEDGSWTVRTNQYIAEQNSGTWVKLWVGSEAQFNEETTPAENTLYVYPTAAEADVEAQVEKIISGGQKVGAAATADNATKVGGVPFSMVDGVLKSGGYTVPLVKTVLNESTLYSSAGGAILSEADAQKYYDIYYAVDGNHAQRRVARISGEGYLRDYDASLGEVVGVFIYAEGGALNWGAKDDLADPIIYRIDEVVN